MRRVALWGLARLLPAGVTPLPMHSTFGLYLFLCEGLLLRLVGPLFGVPWPFRDGEDR